MHVGKGDDNHNSVTFHDQDDELTTVKDEEVCRICRYVQS